MKTDRELLELAAKAVGYELDGSRLDQPLVFNGYGEQETWNPLTDDGDALRLAVRLGMIVEVNLDDGCTRIRDEFGSLILRNMFLDGDAEAATRRAIVRVAAAIGENMK